MRRTVALWLLLAVTPARATEPAMLSAPVPQTPLDNPDSIIHPPPTKEIAQCASSPKLSLHRGVRVATSDLFDGPKADPWPGLTLSASNAAWARVSGALSRGVLPSPGSARPEELVSSLPTDDPPPARGEDLVVRAESARSPWDTDVAMIRISVTARRPRPLDREPVALVAVVDERVEGEGGLLLARASLAEVVSALRPDDMFAIVVGRDVFVNSSTDRKLWSRPMRIGDRRAALEAIEQLTESDAPTDLPSALADGYMLLAEMSEYATRHILLVSDGDLSLIEEEDDLSYLVSHRRDEGIGLSGIGHGDRYGRDEGIESLARLSGGTYLHIGDPDDARRNLGDHLSALIEPVVTDVRLLVDWGPDVIGVHRSGYHHDRLSSLSSQSEGRELGAGRTLTVIYEVKTAPGSGRSPLGTVSVRATPLGSENPRTETTKIPSASVALADASPSLKLAVAASRFAEMLGQERPLERGVDVLALALGASRPEYAEDAELVEMIRAGIPLLRAPRCW